MSRSRICVRSYGCSTNIADGEVLAGCLIEAGYTLERNSDAADLVIYNTCGVKGPTENRIISLAKATPRERKVILTGCLPLINPERIRREVRFDGILGPAPGRRIVDAVKRVLEGELVSELKERFEEPPSLNLPREKSSSVVSIVPISYGCLGSCAYCCVRFARGGLRSCSVEEIVTRVERDLASGAKEIWVTAQDTASYGKDIGANLAELLKAIAGVHGDFRVRVGMMTPNLAAGMLDQLVEAFQSERIFKFLHLPVQSGDVDTLRRMQRSYSPKDFRRIVDSFRMAMPQITISTDIICGFPGESAEAFDRTLQLIEDIEPDVVNISRFFARQGTPAAEMKESFVPRSEIDRRSFEAQALSRRIALKRNLRWVGWCGEILVDEKGKVLGSWVGRNFAYKPVVVKSACSLLGRMLSVKITGCHPTYLEAQIVG